MRFIFSNTVRAVGCGYPLKSPIPFCFANRPGKAFGYFGAVRLRDGKFLFQRQDNRFNGETFHKFLMFLRQRTLGTDRQVVLILDNAQYHHSKFHKDWRAKHAANFELSFLPPYSPDLNPIERVWKLTRRLCLHNKYFPALDQVVQSVETQFLQWRKGNLTLRRLCAII